MNEICEALKRLNSRRMGHQNNSIGHCVRIYSDGSGRVCENPDQSRDGLNLGFDSLEEAVAVIDAIKSDYE